MSLAIVGISHRTAPLEVRERFVLDAEKKLIPAVSKVTAAQGRPSLRAASSNTRAASSWRHGRSRSRSVRRSVLCRSRVHVRSTRNFPIRSGGIENSRAACRPSATYHNCPRKAAPPCSKPSKRMAGPRRPPGPKPSNSARRPRKRASICSVGARKRRLTTAPLPLPAASTTSLAAPRCCR